MKGRDGISDDAKVKRVEYWQSLGEGGGGGDDLWCQKVFESINVAL